MSGWPPPKERSRRESTVSAAEKSSGSDECNVEFAACHTEPDFSVKMENAVIRKRLRIARLGKCMPPRKFSSHPVDALKVVSMRSYSRFFFKGAYGRPSAAEPQAKVKENLHHEGREDHEDRRKKSFEKLSELRVLRVFVVRLRPEICACRENFQR
jgi:hypothetical protein